MRLLSILTREVQAKIVKDPSGKVFLLLGDVVYPIAQELVNQAKGIEDNSMINSTTTNSENTLQPFDLEKLKNNFNSFSINDFNVRGIFTFKWITDFDGDGYASFEEFKQIKRSFYDNENFMIVVDYEKINNPNEQLILEINNDYTGKLMYSKKNELPGGEFNFKLMYYNISAGDLPVGTYILIAKLQDSETKKIHSSMLERFEIIKGNSETKEIPIKKENTVNEIINRSTPEGILLIDHRDGQKYKIVEIGNQWWMAENLNFETEDSWCYDDNPENCKTYGRLYLWGATKKACPSGWHLPTDNEWKTLVDYLGGESVAGGKMKETGTYHWKSPNKGATNSSGFTALLCGYRNIHGSFTNLGNNAYFWSAAQTGSSGSWYRCLYYENADVRRGRSYDRSHGYSVRCVKD